MASTQTIAPIAPAEGRFDTAKNTYMVGPAWDWLLIIGSPLIALALGLIASLEIPADAAILPGVDLSRGAHRFIIAFTAAHLFIVIFRSHLNKDIFNTHPMRFTLVPAALLAAILISDWAFVCVVVLGVWWDVYHSALQTFGIGRIYDMKRGNDGSVGRRLDWWLNILIYIGPILAGATMMAHVKEFNSFEQFGDVFFTSIPAYAETNQRYATWAIVGLGVPYIVFYIASYMRLAKQGYEVSGQKVALLVSTAICTIWGWGFNAFGEAFFIVNFFHALQYFAIVWWSEKKHMAKTFGFESRTTATRDTLVVLIAVGTAYGSIALFAKAIEVDFLVRVMLVVSIMHFWYDGFIWSVRKKQVSAA